MSKVFNIGMVCSVFGILLPLAGCASNSTPDNAPPPGGSSPLAGSKAPASDPGRVAPQGPRGAGR